MGSIPPWGIRFNWSVVDPRYCKPVAKRRAPFTNSFFSGAYGKWEIRGRTPAEARARIKFTIGKIRRSQRSLRNIGVLCGFRSLLTAEMAENVTQRTRRFYYQCGALARQSRNAVAGRFGALARRDLSQARREIRQDEKRRVNLLEKFSVRLRFLLHALPLRVVLKGFPIRRCGFAAGMLKDVDQSIALLRFIDRSPIRNALQAVAIEDLDGVVAKARLEFGQLAGCGVIDAKLVDGSRRL
jgi:hypothetical protein